MINLEYEESELTGRIIGCAMEVHRHLGCGFQEVIYQRAMAIEMKNLYFAYSREQEMIIKYKSVEIGTRRVDFFVEGKVMVELKAVKNLEDVHLAQAINYLEVYGLKIGLLINFGSVKMQFKRVMNKKKLIIPSVKTGAK